MRSHQHRVPQELTGVLVFVGVIWASFLISLLLPAMNDFGLRPRSVNGLVGVLTMPFLHAGLPHILSNTVPLVVLLTLLAGSRGSTPAIVAAIVLVGGGLLWLFGRNGTPQSPREHIGASGLVFGLAAFLIAAGPLEKRLAPMAVAILVGFLYGLSLLQGMLPLQPHVSWDGHLCGAIAGVLVALAVARPDRSAAGTSA